VHIFVILTRAGSYIKKNLTKTLSKPLNKAQA
jgi:hypothetical protein